MNSTFLVGFAALTLCVSCRYQTAPPTVIPLRANAFPSATTGFNLVGLRMESSSGDGDSSALPPDPDQTHGFVGRMVSREGSRIRRKSTPPPSSALISSGTPLSWPGRRRSSPPTSGSKGNYPVAIFSSIRIRPISLWEDWLRLSADYGPMDSRPKIRISEKSEPWNWKP